MKRTNYFFLSILSILIISLGIGITIARVSKTDRKKDLISWVDNQRYWLNAAKKGLVDYNPDMDVAPAIFTGSKIKATTVSTIDSPDVPTATINSTQSENSVFINPLDETNLLNSNNSTNGTIDTAYGANSLFSFTSGETWEGSIEGPGENNGGDPSATIGLNGRWFVNYISEDNGMGVSFSDDQGQSWTVREAAPNPGDVTDKNHMWIDNNTSSPYEGNVYVAWTNIGGLYHGEIGFSYSTDDGDTWTLVEDISSGVNAGSHNQGVNLSTGPGGELYAVWAIYDTWFSGGSDEAAIGMAVSLDGGVSWEPATRIIDNIRGIRATKTSKNMRVNSFPVAAVDNSNGADNGAIYITWCNIGYPGLNTGEDIDIYVIRSTNNGATWSDPGKVNLDEPGQGKQHFFPWLTCDPTTGILSMVYYDDRNVGPEQCEVYCANSVDGGLTWEEFKVSDVSFTPSPIPGLADKYMGDYLGIHAKNGVVYPIWTDNRTGKAMSYCSPYQTNPVNRPFDLEGEIVFETGTTNLNWSYESAEGFLYFIIYRDGDSIASTADTTFSEILPDYGVYTYRVTAYYTGDIESGASGISLQWGYVVISTQPDSIYQHVAIGNEAEDEIFIINNGQLDLEYNISLFTSRSSRDYCVASGNSGPGEEYISGVEVGSISNLNTGNDNYTDYSNLSTTMTVGESYDITVTNGKTFDLDQCGVWIDWNRDEVFDVDELTVLDMIIGTDTFKGKIYPPPGSISGTTKMRVRLTYHGDLEPCGNTIFGEVEDYSVFVKGWLDIFPLQGMVLPGDTGIINVVFSAVDLPVGYYNTIAFIQSNDPVNSNVQIPLAMRADHIVVDAVANEENVCSGQIILLTAEIEGSFDSLSYEWTSNPEGFNSNLARPLALPVVPTWYRVLVIDGANTATDSVYINLYSDPLVILGADTAVCASSELVLDAGNEGSNYLWSTGDTTKTIVVDTSQTGFGIQTISVEVIDTNGCTGQGEITIDFVNCSGQDEYAELYVEVYPNPGSGNFVIKSTEISGKLSIQLFDISGTVVHEQKLSSFPQSGMIDVKTTGLSNGNYILLLKSDDYRITKKIIINN